MLERISIEGFRIERLIGAGAFGSVHLAHRGRTLVAVKIFDRALGERYANESFRREIAALERLDNVPTIISPVGSGFTSDGHPYIVLPYYEHGSLADRITRHGPLPIGDAISITSNIASALSFAHRQGILHRDLKPSNVLFDDDGAPRVSDFGLSMGAGTGETTLSTGWGSPAYMSPERLDGHPAIPQSDLYSLGATFYTMLAGRPPFGPAASIFELIGAVRTTEPPPLTRVDIPADVERVLSELLDKDPARRPSDAESVATRLDEIFEEYGFTSSANVPSGPPPANRTRRGLRMRALLAVSAGLTAVAVIWTILPMVSDRHVDISSATSTTSQVVSTSTTPRTPMDAPPFGIVEPVVRDDRYPDDTPRLRKVLDTVDSLAVNNLGGVTHQSTDVQEGEPGVYPARFSYFFVNAVDSPGCTTFFGWELFATGGVKRMWLTARILASVKSFAAPADAHAYFTGYSIEFGARPGDCHRMPGFDGKPNIGPPEVLKDAWVDHDDFPVETAGFDEVNSWSRPSQVVPGFSDHGVVARLGDTIVLFTVVDAPEADVTQRIDSLLSAARAALDRHPR